MPEQTSPPAFANTTSSASRQHFIDTGEYLSGPAGEEGDPATPWAYANSLFGFIASQDMHWSAGWLVGVEGVSELPGNPMPLQAHAATAWLAGYAAGRYADANGWATPTEKDLAWRSRGTVTTVSVFDGPDDAVPSSTTDWPSAESASRAVLRMAVEAAPPQASIELTLTRVDDGFHLSLPDGQTVHVD